jgi:Cdc6-like AAA superfamily ATPase
MTRLDTIDLTDEQKHAMQTLYNFLIDHKQNTFGLYGYAGSGKTTTVVEFVSYMISNKYLNAIAFTAPTNKAVNVIKAKFKTHLKKIVETLFDKTLDDTFNFDDELEFLDQAGICIKFITIHKLLMFQTDYAATGETIFVRDAKQGSMISQFELCIIDECSMISMDMIDSIFEEIRNMSKHCAGKNKGYKHIPKLVFSGDPAQLPPINEDDSSIFCKNSKDLIFKAYMEAMSYKVNNIVASDSISIMKHRYKILLGDLVKMKTILLKNVVRSRLDVVTQVCHEFRKWIKSDELPDFQQFNAIPGVEFFDNDQSTNKIQSNWFKKFLNSVKNGNTSIIVTWTNKQTDIYNDTIRQHIFRGKKIRKFEEHDVLMLSEFYGLDLGEEFVKQKLYTSEQIKVISTKLSEIPIRSFEMVTNCGIKRMKQGIKVEGRIKELVDGLNEVYCKNTKFMCWVLKVHKFGEESGHHMTLIVLDDIDHERYEKFKSESSIAIKNFAKQLLNQYRTGPKQIESFIIKPLWKQWNKIFVDPFASVNYGYSITCHKAQGSSFYDVYVDLDDILLNSQRPVEAKKCAYTAATRTSNELNVLV